MLPCVVAPGRALVVFSGRTGGQQRAEGEEPLLCVVEGGGIVIVEDIKQKFPMEGCTSLVAAGVLEYVLPSQITVIFPGSVCVWFQTQQCEVAG